MTANYAHNVESFRISKYFEETLCFFIKLSFMRILVIHALRDDSIIRLRYNGNQEVQQDDQVEELV
jgi:hypothetical protein